MESWICPECSKAVSANETIVVVRGHIAHWFCRQPRALSPEERALLFYYCRQHEIAKCPQGAGAYRQSELVWDVFESTEHLCPHCRADLLDGVRAHLYNCETIPAEVRRRAQALREAARALVKQGHELSDRADVLMREAENALDSLRKTIRALPKRSI